MRVSWWRRPAGLIVAAVMVAGCSGAGATAAPGATAAASGATAGASEPASVVTPSGSSPDVCTPSPSGSLPGYQTLVCPVPAPSLASNMLGDPAALDAMILLPEGYDGGSTRYPAIYVLAGYTDPTSFLYQTVSAALYGVDRSAVKPSILVFVSGIDALGGSFYVNSPVSGNWEDAITKDLVGYVDAHYRTIAAAASRGIAGHSMGGFGALNIAMRHADEFGAVFALSPGLFADEQGADDRVGEGDGGIEAVLDAQRTLTSMTAADRKAQYATVAGGTSAGFLFAYGTAFAPDPSSPTLMKYPFSMQGGQVVRDDAIWKAWEAGFGDLPGKIATYGSNLKALKAIAIDYGTLDEYGWIPKGSHAFVTQLTAAGIKVTETTFEGGHGDQLGSRVAGFMLPFFSQNLASN